MESPGHHYRGGVGAAVIELRRTRRVPLPQARPDRQARLRRADVEGRRAALKSQVSAAWVLGKLMAAVLLVGGIWLIQQGAASSELRVARIVVEGNALVREDEITAALAVEGTHLFFVRTRRLERILEADPAIERAQVHAVLPHTVLVAVQERLPAVVWNTGETQMLTDAQGLALRIGAQPLPTVHAPSSPVIVGARVDASAVRIAQTVGPRLDTLGLAGAVLEYQPGSGVSVVKPGSYRVALGSSDRLEAKLDAYWTIRQYLEQTRTPAELIDVRFLDRPYFR